ncbi:putative Rep protein [Circovirus-like genome DHCV-4]|uniref:Replication-associated protein n=1 Tax=Circovirus-like genome DHCV-4 TaxID=1788453 RepID=A0A190WHF1_9VIRU|nr:putative Rep protein [Circovirus-like genome DHCV-4]
MNVRSRDWCFTVNNYTYDDYKVCQELSVMCQYVVIGKEVAETGTKHLQCYVYFENAKSFSKMKKLLPNQAHIEKAGGTPQDASNYCKKGEQPKDEWKALKHMGPQWGLNADFWEHGSLPQPSGTRNDLKEIREMLAQGKGMRDVIEVATSYQSMKSAELILKYKERKRNWKPKVIWLWGRSGIGKTRAVYEECPNIYRKSNNSGKWWDGYDAHENVLIDDVKDTSEEFYSMLLEILDRYDVRVQTKGATREFLAKTIYLTSLEDPRIMYRSFPEEGYELYRRIDEIRHVT